MATLVFTTLGSALGGPIGGAIGALAGQAFDSQIFKPKGREGPRLSDLSVQTSRYGTQIPHLFGTMRMAGTVIWSTDLREARTTGDAGKGQPSLTSYSYSASFAVALSARPILRIGRIWADGNLLRGNAGDFKTALGGFRIHDGSPGQVPDPLIAAAVGLEQAPAFCDLAYVLFEDLQLADFGNRIPSLSFEVTADEGPVTVGTIATALLGDYVGDPAAGISAVLGYAADGSDAGDALAPLIDAHRLRWRSSKGAVSLVDAAPTGRTLALEGELRAVDGRAEAPGRLRRAPLEEVPVKLSVQHFDPDRDYQLGLQTAERSGAGHRNEELGLPAALSADSARQLADRNLRAAVRERQTIAKAFGWSVLDLKAGDAVSVEGQPGDWLVEVLEWDNMAPRLSLRARVLDAAILPAAGDAGEPLRQPDRPQGTTVLAAVELLPLDGSLAAAPLVYAAATGADAGWRRAALFRYHADLAVADPLGSSAPRALLGMALAALAPAAPWTIDACNHVDIQLENAQDALLGADDEALARQANLCAIGAELLQFGYAEPIGPGRYRLTRLIRGWHGTEWAIGGHGLDERFVLIDPSRLTAVPTTPADMGIILALRASGIGDATPAEAALAVDGRAILPPSPTHGGLSVIGDGGLMVSWTRRSRLGWQWRDGGEVPLAEEREAYRIAIKAGDVILRAVDVAEPIWTYAASDLLTDIAAAAGVTLVVEIRQIGTYGLSHPLILAIREP